MQHKAIECFIFSIILGSYFHQGKNSVKRDNLIRNVYNKNTQSKHSKKRQELVASSVRRRLNVFFVLNFQSIFHDSYEGVGRFMEDPLFFIKSW